MESTSSLQDIAALVQAASLAIAGFWALFIYRRRRAGQVGVGIEASVRLIRDWHPGRSLLLVKVQIKNTSGVVYWHREATATLMDARNETPDGRVRLVPFRRADPMPPVYGNIAEGVAAIREGDLFRLGESTISLEPGEHVDSEIAFVLDTEKLGLMALRILVQGQQRRSRLKFLQRVPLLRPRDYWWGRFLYVVPEAMKIESLEPTEGARPDATR